MELIKQILPWLGAALTGPAGLAALAVEKIAPSLGLTDKTIENVTATLKGLSPEQLASYKKLDQDFELQMKQAGYKHLEQLRSFDVDVIKAVNETMRVELANSEKEDWYQKGWRPANGFAVAIGSLFSVFMTCIAFILCIFYGKPEAFSQLPILAGAIATILMVPGAAVGISAWHRGAQKRDAAKKQS